MVTQRNVLKYIARRTRKELSTTSEDVAEKFDLHLLSACDHLKRLWQERLIRAIPVRPRGSRYRLQTRERLEDLRFLLAPRGKERLEWYQEQEEEGEWV